MRIDRRKALALLGLGAATPAAAQSSTVSFKHGVASGDPDEEPDEDPEEPGDDGVDGPGIPIGGKLGLGAPGYPGPEKPGPGMLEPGVVVPGIAGLLGNPGGRKAGGWTPGVEVAGFCDIMPVELLAPL